MLNQGQGTYPQLAGSFYNSQQMMPHDNGRNAQQVPTFFGGLQNMMSAQSAMNNYQGIPLGQSILNTQALASQRYADARGHVLSGIGTGLTALGAVGTVGTLLGGASLGTVGGILGGLASAPMSLATMAVGGVVHGYNKRMDAMRDMRNAMEGSRLGYGLSDPITGTITNSAAYQLSKMMENSTRGAGFHGSELKTVMGQASGLGMLNGMQSLGEVTKKVTDLAKASREIVMLGEGISMTDAMHLQKLTQDMGISTAKFRGTNIGKNLVMAARASSMSLDQAAQVGGMGAATYQQMGLGAAAGMNAAFHTSIAAQGLVGAGAFSQRQLAALGGQQGIAQSLLAGQAGTMGRMADALVMGTVKLGEDGQFRIDRSMLDRFVTGKVSSEELIERGKNIGKDMSKGQRSRLLESLQFAMPELKEQMTDMISSEEKMAIQARGVLELQKNTGLSMRRAAQAYFQDAGQAEAFLGYANNFDASRAEMNRQNSIAQQENMFRYAGMAKSSSMVSRAGRAVVSKVSGAVDALMLPFYGIGDYIAEGVSADADRSTQAYRDIMGVKDYGNLSRGVTSTNGRGISLLDLARGRRDNVSASYTSNLERAQAYLLGDNAIGEDAYLRKIGRPEGLNRLGGGGLGGKLTEFEEGEYSPLRQIGDALGIEDIFGGGKDLLLKHAYINDQAEKMGDIMRRHTSFNYSDSGALRARNKILAKVREISFKAAKGTGSGEFGGASGRDLLADNLLNEVENMGLTDAQKESALADVMRYSQTAGGELSIGFNKLMRATVDVLGMSPLDRKGAGLDTLTLGGGATFTSKGLSEALSQSGMDTGDLNKLIQAFSTRGKQLAGEGSGVDSLRFIMNSSGIDADKYKNRMGAVRNVIEAVRKGRVTSKSKDSEGKEVTKEQSLEEAANSGINIGSLTRNAAEAAASEADKQQLEAANKRLMANLGKGGELLISGLADTQTVTNSEDLRKLAENKLREYYSDNNVDLSAQVKESLQQELDSISQQIKDEEEYINRPRVRGATTRSLHGGVGSSSGSSSHHQNTLAAKRRLEELQARHKLIKNNLASGKGEAYSHYLEKATTDLVDKTIDQKYLKAFRANRKTLSDYSSLTDVLTNIGGGEGTKETDNLLKLLKSTSGSALKVDFEDFKARSKTMGEKERATEEKRLIDKIIKAGINSGTMQGNPNKDQSIELPKLMEKISLGLDQFTNAMSNIANLTATNNTVTLSIPQLKGKADA
jgi:hypothetical protein